MKKIFLLVLIFFMSCSSYRSNQQSMNENLVVEWTFYHSNGEIKRIESFSNGKKQGIWTFYNVDRKLIREEEYKKGKLESERKF